VQVLILTAQLEQAALLHFTELVTWDTAMSCAICEFVCTSFAVAVMNGEPKLYYSSLIQSGQWG